MKSLYLIPFLIIFTFNVNEVFLFAQATKSTDKRRSYSNIYRGAISNIEDSYDRMNFDNASYVQPRKRQLLEFFRNELSSQGEGDLESRIDDLDNVLDKTPGMFCTADEENLNEKFIQLNLAHDDYEYTRSGALRSELDRKERDLRKSIIDAIDNALATNGVCDNTPSAADYLDER